MSGRLTRTLQRWLTVLWRDQLSQSDIEELEANIERVGLVIRIRWAIVGAILIFSVLGIGIYAIGGQAALLWRQMLIPALALAFVLLYNAFYQRTYRQFGNIAPFNVGQLLLDIAVVTVLIYYSGGVYSWFDGMLFLFVLEAALILPRRREVALVAGAAAVAYVGLVVLVLFGILPHMAMPFVTNDLQTVASYVAVRALWTVTVITGTAMVASLFVRATRDRTSAAASLATKDARTGLNDRAAIRRELTLEIERSRRFRRGVSVILADIDSFEHFNELFGMEAGNRMIDRISGLLREMTGWDTSEPRLIVPGRYGGEEFALIVPEDAASSLSDAEQLAERLRAGVAAILDQDRSVAMSIGVASYPSDGRTASEMLSSADAALARAAALGGNRVVIGRPPHEAE